MCENDEDYVEECDEETESISIPISKPKHEENSICLVQHGRFVIGYHFLIILFLFFNSFKMTSEFSNLNNSYFQNIKFTNDKIKYIGNFLV
jgi:hypothetical protein